MGIELTDEQLALKRECVDFVKHKGSGKQYYYYSGAAGTGKTTVIKCILDDLKLKHDQVIACAYTGKAVLNLLRHGLNACTIHSLIYNPIISSEKVYMTDEFGNPKKVKRRKLEFILKEKIDEKIKLIILDEVGMVNDKMLSDLMSFNLPIIMMGDHNQLPPVFGKSSILDFPDFTLTKIMRQEENNPIVYLSQCILKGIPIEYGNYGTSRVIPSISINKSMIDDYDIILCGKNKTREVINDRIRSEVLGYTSRKPMLYDRIICRQNDWDEKINGIYLTNGLTGIITDIDYCSSYRGIIYISFKPDFVDGEFERLKLDYEFIKADWREKKEKKEFGFVKDKERFEYSYAITVHLSQGSEYSRVLYIDELFHDPDTLKRLRYTAITRAVDSITYVQAEQRRTYQYNYNGYGYNL